MPLTMCNMEKYYVALEGICKSYQMDGIDTVALRDIDLSIEKGEFVCISGPSGSGKTTLLNIIGCIDTADAGMLHIGGEPVNNLGLRELALLRRRHFGFIFQSHNLIPVLSIYENVEYALLLKQMSAKERKERVAAALEAVGLGGCALKRPRNLSVGQQQRVAVARAIVGQPPVVLADEPTASLDSRNGEALLDLFESLNKTEGITFLFSSHDHRIIERAQRVITLVDGCIA